MLAAKRVLFTTLVGVNCSRCDELFVICRLNFGVSKDSDNPDYVTDVNKTAEALSKHISLSKEEIVKLLSQKDASQVEFEALVRICRFKIQGSD